MLTPYEPRPWERSQLRALLTALLIAAFQGKAPLDEFRARRAALRQSLDGGVLLLKGRPKRMTRSSALNRSRISTT